MLELYLIDFKNVFDFFFLFGHNYLGIKSSSQY